MPNQRNQSPIDTLTGLGPKSKEILSKVGIHTLADLKRVGVIDAYLLCKKSNATVTLNLLWGMQGAVTEMHWTLIPPGVRKKLKEQVEKRLKA